jgi:hypothetical protein
MKVLTKEEEEEEEEEERKKGNIYVSVGFLRVLLLLFQKKYNSFLWLLSYSRPFFSFFDLTCFNRKNVLSFSIHLCIYRRTIPSTCRLEGNGII